MAAHGPGRGGAGGGPHQRHLSGRPVSLAGGTSGREADGGAVAHSLLVMDYTLLTKQQTYHELGSQYFAARDRQAVQRRLVHRLEALGYQVSLEPTSPSAA